MAKMKDGFDSLPWHDSELTSFSFDRSAPGEKISLYFLLGGMMIRSVMLCLKMFFKHN